MIVENMQVVAQEEIAPSIFRLRLSGDCAGEMKIPGQFVHVQVEQGINPTLRRPLSICDVDVENRELTLIYRVEGKGTKRLTEKRPGDAVNVFGPLGKGFPAEVLKEKQTAVLIGGGVGIPPLYYLAKQLVNRDVNVMTILGFRTAADVFLEKEFTALGETVITTEDGTKGLKGYVTDAFRQLPENAYDLFYTCGPKPMLQAVETAALSPGYISLEERMGCGIGACLACVCDLTVPDSQSGKKYRKICSDGPVFRAGEVMI
ncbi:dihydroorotate dehydrogenase electron transfer subunit [Evansella caseinilytica]|uniref:Dihydroorotate dehydrogenase B (NAD(+)), electron transfer subunit n=1 Tax=Evansella caseinilytica TaxID=1503961 RepID=A0A1H3ME29_9BACI|nr:dihydroorotate dehydrogenase electron transfer subunit [Evansella caseinilytica]SDY74866.1 dihydroorotate dehydrogenase electron transfer subunit [Evansella caseinilytica]